MIQEYSTLGEVNQFLWFHRSKFTNLLPKMEPHTVNPDKPEDHSMHVLVSGLSISGQCIQLSEKSLTLLLSELGQVQ